LKENPTLSKISKDYIVFIKKFFSELFDDKITFYASSLSWNTIFAMVPLLAIALAIFTALPIFDQLYGTLQKIIFDTLVPTNSKIIIDNITAFLQNTQSLGIVGFIYVLIATTIFFKNYDHILNDIYEAPKRSFLKMLRVYALFFLLLPLIVYLSFWISLVGNFSSILEYIISFILTWFSFFTLFWLSPNRTIVPLAAFISSFITALLWYISKSLFLFYILQNQTYATLYGSISTVLFFFLWIYLSWAIFLHGARFCHLLDLGKDIETQE
jgi:membrane protein